MYQRALLAGGLDGAAGMSPRVDIFVDRRRMSQIRFARHFNPAADFSFKRACSKPIRRLGSPAKHLLVLRFAALSLRPCHLQLLRVLLLEGA
jgi:hypothetical protein